MKKIGILLLFVAVVCCAADDAQADLIQGYFSGNIDIDGHVDELADGASFAGQFVYDTDAIVNFDWSSGDETTAVVSGAFVELSAALVGINDIYTFSIDNNPWEPDTFVTYSTDGAGDYILDFDGLEGVTDFIGELDLHQPELILAFSNTSVTDSDFPVIMPDPDDFIAGSSYFGSVLHMWVWDDQGVNPGNAQINGNITSLSLQRYSQPVPEPASVALVAGGLAFLAGYRKKRKGFFTS